MIPTSPSRTGEILAPAGDQACLEAALAAGADAVYFGLDEGFNARARASNFRMERLPEVVSMVHRAGARAYLTLNTLVFEPELPVLQPILRDVAKAGVDALIVQDPGLALLAKTICPELELHASTQMTISSPEGAEFAKGLQITRVVVPRELSVKEIRTFKEGTDLELETFVMGALCVSWSGQCLSSEAWGGRSANRGKCAQACRLPYELVVDNEVKPLGEVSYLLSPQDLAGFRAVEELLDVGVHTLKIEGRQKGPDYVHHAVASMRRWVDGVRQNKPDQQRLANLLSLAGFAEHGGGHVGVSVLEKNARCLFVKGGQEMRDTPAELLGDTVKAVLGRSRPGAGQSGLSSELLDDFQRVGSVLGVVEQSPGGEPQPLAQPVAYGRAAFEGEAVELERKVFGCS